MFDENIQKKLTRVNSTVMLTDSTIDTAVKEQEVLYVMFVDPDTHKPKLIYFEVLQMDNFGQTALEMMAAVKHPFKENKHTKL